MRLSDRFKKGVQWSAISSVIASGLQFLQLLLLVRFVDKADFGRYAAVAFFFQICLQIQECGINNTLIHKGESNPNQLGALFWRNSMLGIALCILLWAAGGVIEYWYRDELLGTVATQFALVLPLMGASSTFKAMRQLELNYKNIGTIEVVAALIAFTVAITLGYQGFGLQALVIGAIVKYAAEAMLYLLFRPHD